MYDAIVDRIDWADEARWRLLLANLDDAQRAIVAVAAAHGQAAFDGIETTVDFHGPGGDDPDSSDFEERWDRDLQIEAFIEAHADEFFVDDG